MSFGRTVVVIAKSPVAGRVKTRLCPPLRPREAAALAAAVLHDTLRAVGAVPDARRVLALDGAPGWWLPSGFDVIAQPDGGLDVRLGSALEHTSGPTVIVGMDTPQVTTADLETALATLRSSTDAVLGPAVDGGFWLLGLARPDPRAVLGVAMSRSDTGLEQRRRLDDLGLSTTLHREMLDVDHYDDAIAVAALSPDSAFAAALLRIGDPTLSPVR
jgi:uncharacterized protein